MKEEYNKIKDDKIVSKDTISTKRALTKTEIKPLAIIGIILCCVILLNGILTQNKYNIYVENGKVIKEGEEPLSLENTLEYLSKAPDINIKKLVMAGGAAQAQAIKISLEKNGISSPITTSILDVVAKIAEVVGYIVLPLTFVINALIVIIYYIGVLFI